MKYLQNINSPDDLKKLNVDQLETVCSELRDFIIEQLRIILAISAQV